MDMKLLREAALDYHRVPTPSKIHVAPTKGLTNQHDLWLAFSPGVAYACLAIRDNSQEAATLTFLTEIVPRADLFLESSAGSVLNPDVLNGMEADPLTLALASQSRRSGPSWRSPDAIPCTGRSDYPNQVNNVLCFPFIFRGALDVGPPPLMKS